MYCSIPSWHNDGVRGGMERSTKEKERKYRTEGKKTQEKEADCERETVTRSLGEKNNSNGRGNKGRGSTHTHITYSMEFLSVTLYHRLGFSWIRGLGRCPQGTACISLTLPND